MGNELINLSHASKNTCSIEGEDNMRDKMWEWYGVFHGNDGGGRSWKWWMETKEESREEKGGDNFEMKDFRARNRSRFVKRVHAHEGHGYHKWRDHKQISFKSINTNQKITTSPQSSSNNKQERNGGGETSWEERGHERRHHWSGKMLLLEAEMP